MSLVLSSYQLFQISEQILTEIEKLHEKITGFSGKQPNVPLTVLQIKIVFALTSPIDAGESKRIQNLIQDKIQGEKYNPSNLKTQWDKTRPYVGGSPKYELRRQVLICSLTIPHWILTEPLVFTCIILNCPNFSPRDFWYFPSLIIYAYFLTSQLYYTRFSFSRLLLLLIFFASLATSPCSLVGSWCIVAYPDQRLIFQAQLVVCYDMSIALHIRQI